MGQANSKRDALINIMTRWYEEISEIEARHGIFVSADELRPRIEYFHDAVRTLTEHPEDMYAKTGRLTVETLAYDLSSLRYIEGRPLARLHHERHPRKKEEGKPKEQGMGEKIAGLITGKKGQVGKAKPSAAEQRNYSTPNASVRAELSERYRNYTVMFAALFAETVDMNYKTRVSEYDEQVEDLAQVEQMLQMLEQGQIAQEEVEDVILHLSDEELKTELMIALHEQAQHNRKIREMVQKLKYQMGMADQIIASMDNAHMTYLSGQMMLFQESRDMVKKLAAQGLNVAGQYLENAVQAVARGQGRGY